MLELPLSWTLLPLQLLLPRMVMVVRKQRIKKHRQLRRRVEEDIAIWHWIKDWYIVLYYSDMTVNEKSLHIKRGTHLACLMCLKLKLKYSFIFHPLIKNSSANSFYPFPFYYVLEKPNLVLAGHPSIHS